MPQLLSKLKDALSQEEGERLLWESSDELTDDIAATLKHQADEFLAANDRLGSEEYQAWADLARSLVTLRRIRSINPSSPEQPREILESCRSQYDDAFINLLDKIASQKLHKMRHVLERIKAGDPEVDPSAQEVIDEAQFEASFLRVIADSTQNPAYQAQAQMVYGTFLLFLARLKEARAQDANDIEAILEQARVALTACAENELASLAIRAKAEANLAAVAGEARLDLVEQHQTKAQQLAEQAGDLDILRTTRRDRAFWAKKRHDWDTAFKLYQQNIEDTERALWKESSHSAALDLVSETRYDYQAIVEICLARAKENPSYYERALEFADQGKARAFLRSLVDIGSAYKFIPPRLTQRRTRIKNRLKELGDLQKEYSTEIAELHKSEMEELIRALGKTEAQIQSCASRSAFNLQCAPLKFAEMLALVPDKGAILSYFSMEDRLLIFVLTQQGLVLPPTEVPLSPEDLARVRINLAVGVLSRYTMRDHLKTLQDQLPEILDFFLPTDTLRFSYQVLIEPIEQHIKDLSLLYIIPHASLQEFPFQALRKENGTYLIDDVAIAYAPSLAVLRHCRDHARSSYQTCFAAGVSQKHGGPKVASDEAVSVANIFHTQTFPATRDAVQHQAGQFDVIHLSCHGDTHSAITSFQGFALADGTLYQNEIAGIDCCSSLVFLSACNTAHGDLIPGQDTPMTGLIGAFIRAGSPSVIASLWEVDTESALITVPAFYNALKNKSVNKAEALRQAQIELKSQKPHPFFWAPFSLWGFY